MASSSTTRIALVEVPSVAVNAEDHVAFAIGENGLLLRGTIIKEVCYL